MYCFAPWPAPPTAGGKVPKAKAKLEVATGAKRGRWNDWQAGRYGDALGLVGCILTGQPDQRTSEARSQGVRWARDRYGIAGGDYDREAWRRNVERAAAEQKQREAEARAKLKRDRNIAQAVWINGDALRPTEVRPGGVVRGCDGARYLEARGIDFARLGRLPRAVRFSPAERWAEISSDGEVLSEHVGPALVSAMTLKDGTFACLHRIWIDPASPGDKADLDPPRKMWPSSDGAAIRLWRGLNHLSENDAVAKGQRGPLVVCEGVEDGLSIAMLTPEFRVHAAGSLPGLLSYDPPACASEIIVAADNDWDKPQAMELLRRSIDRLSGLGRPVRVARSPEGKDFNDLVRGE